jgi:transposase-like protein
LEKKYGANWRNVTMQDMSKKKAPPEGAASPPERPVPQRVLTTEYKLRILTELETARSSGRWGAAAAILRREGLSRNQVAKWERQRDEALAPQKRGRKKTRSPEAGELARLKRENERLQSRLARAETIIDVQKKLSALLGVELPTSSDGEEES